MKIFNIYPYLCLFFLLACSGAEDSNIDPSPNKPARNILNLCEFDFSQNPTQFNQAQTRHFKMGFTNWNYLGTPESVEQIDTTIIQPTYGDIVALHYMDGVPWNYGNDALYDPVALYDFYPQNLQNYINQRIISTKGAQSIYLAIDQVNGVRNGIAQDFFSQSTPSNFDQDSAQWAFTNFVFVVLYRIHKVYQDENLALPKIYLNLSSEASDLILVDGQNLLGYPLWHELVNHIQFVTQSLNSFLNTNSSLETFIKDATTMISVALKSPSDGIIGNTSTDKMEEVESQFPDIHPFVDMIGVSTYGYIFYDNQFGGTSPDNDRANPSLLETEWLSQSLGVLSGGKDLGITETGWIGQDYDVNLDNSYVITSNASYQKQYLEKLLIEMNSSTRWKFLVWFSLVDFDPLWNLFPEAVKLQGLTWRNTGLFDVNISTQEEVSEGCLASARPSWETWSSWSTRTLVP